MIQVFETLFLSLIKQPVLLEGNVVIGGTGAVGNVKGGGIESVERLGTGVYRINFDRRYNRYLSGGSALIAPATGSPVAAGSLNPTTIYRITDLGTSDFTLVGAKENIVGTAFVASATTAGTGTATAAAAGNIASVQLLSQHPDNCDHVVVQCVTDAGAVANPTAGSVLGFWALLRRSSVKGQGE